MSPLVENMLRRQSIIRLPLYCLLAVSLVPVGLGTTAASADQWTSLTGSSTVSGEMIGMWNGRVLLRLDGGRRVSVRMEDLRAESRIQAEKRLVEIQERLQQTRDEIRAIAEEAEAPAPPQASAELPAAPSYDPPQPGADLQSTLVAIGDQTLAGHPRIFYDTLPASHQELVDELLATGLAKINTESFESTRSTLGALAELVLTRQRWLLSHPRFAQLPEAQQAAILDAANLVRALAADDVLGLAALRSRPIAESVTAINDAVSSHIYRLVSEYSSSFAMLLPELQIEPASDESMSVKVVLPVVGTVGSATYTQVEGRWAAGENAEAAANRWKEMQQSIEPIPDGSLRLPAAAEPVIAQLDDAVVALQQVTTRQAFHRALDEVLPPLVAAINDWSGYQPPRDTSNPYSQSDELYSPEGVPAGQESLSESADTPQ